MISLSEFYLHLFAALASALALFPPSLPAPWMDSIEYYGNVLLSLVLAATACCGLTALSSVWVRPHPVLAAASAVAALFISSLAGCLPAFGWFGYTVVRNVGTFPEFVDRLLADEELRAVLGPEYAKLRAELKRQVSHIAGLKDSVSAICKEHYKHWCTVHTCTAFAPRWQTWIFPAEYADVEWREPCVLLKMCKSLSLSPVPALPVCPRSLPSRGDRLHPKSEPVFFADPIDARQSTPPISRRSSSATASSAFGCSRQPRPHPATQVDGRGRELGVSQLHRPRR